MAKAIKCKVVVNTSNGYCFTPKECGSIKSAIEYAKGMGFAYRIFDMNNKLIKEGYC